ncbi:hypothetical protein [Gimesia sp.]|uniref:hypothetical protein n=1 Tax=Gimesia sp. TaxID=2024833 RepID=UPI0032EE4D09
MIELQANRVGPNHISRWVIKSNKDLYWNGEGWSPYQKDALLFHELGEAQDVIAELMQALLDAMNTWTYRAIIEIEVKGIEKPTLWSLRKHLREHHSVSTGLNVEGPKSTLIIPKVNWDNLKEIR